MKIYLLSTVAFAAAFLPGLAHAEEADAETITVRGARADDFAGPSETGATYAFTDDAAASLRVYNLFDKDYATTTYNDQQRLLGRPRSVDLSVGVKF